MTSITAYKLDSFVVWLMCARGRNHRPRPCCFQRPAWTVRVGVAAAAATIACRTLFSVQTSTENTQDVVRKRHVSAHHREQGRRQASSVEPLAQLYITVQQCMLCRQIQKTAKGELRAAQRTSRSTAKKRICPEMRTAQKSVELRWNGCSQTAKCASWSLRQQEQPQCGRDPKITC